MVYINSLRSVDTTADLIVIKQPLIALGYFQDLNYSLPTYNIPCSYLPPLN